MDTSDNISDGTPITAAPFTDTTAPAEASNLNYTNPISGDMQITLEWDDPDDIDFLHVEITHDQPGGTESVIVNKGFKTTDISGMLNGKNYVFTVKTVDFNDNISNGITLEVLPGPGLGNWTQGAPFTSGRVEHASVIYNGYLYIVGGQTGGAAYANDVQYTQIFPDGSLGSWTTNATSFTTGRSKHSCIAYNNYLYVMGGYYYSSGHHYLDDVQYAPIDPVDGSVGEWQSLPSLPTKKNLHKSIEYNGFIYIVDGNEGSSYSNSVIYAQINTDGTLGTWQTASSFANARYHHAIIVWQDYLYLLGGYGSSSTEYNDVQYASIWPDGHLGTWNFATPLTENKRRHSAIVINGYIYVLGGYLSEVVEYAPIYEGGPIGSWTGTTPLIEVDGHTDMISPYQRSI